MPTFVVHTPVGVNQIVLKSAIQEAVAEATRRGKLRPNSVDSLTGKNSGNNLGAETPVIHFEQWEEDEIEVKLILKGGGCENKNIQYSLPVRAGAHGHARTAISKACASAFCTRCGRRKGRAARRARWACASAATARTATMLAKEQLFRTLDDVNPHPDLAQARNAKSWRRPIVWASARWDSAAKSSLIGCKIMRRQPPARQLLRFRGLRVLGLPPAGRPARCRERRDHRMAVSRSLAARRKNGARRGLPADRPRNRAAAAHQRGAGARAQGRRRGADHAARCYTGRDAVHALSDEESAARRRRSARRGALSLRSGDAQSRASSGP